MDWHAAIAKVTPYIVQITTPQGSGTGWLVSQSKTSPLCGIATARHVISHAHYWEEPIRVIHAGTGKTILLHDKERSIHTETNLD